MMPAFAKPRRKVQLARDAALRAFADECPFNRLELKGSKIGVICTGAVYQHVVEALPEASVLKLGMSWPVPESRINELSRFVDEVYVVEEASTYLSDAVQPQAPACRSRLARFPATAS